MKNVDFIMNQVRAAEELAVREEEVGHLLIYQSPACFTDPLTIIVIDMLLRCG